MPDTIELTKDSFDTGKSLDAMFSEKFGTPPPAPSEIIDPAKPAAGGDPAAPAAGGEPAKTPDPAKPAAPAAPAAGGEPAKPATPATPAEGGEPAKPATPTAPTPEEIAALAGVTPAEPAAPAAPAPPPEPSEAVKKIEDVKLSPHAQPRTAEAFATVKTLAKEEIGRLSTALASAQAKLAEVEKLPKADPMSEADRAELEKLREFRASVQLRGDPQFVAKFDKPLAELDDKFFSQLKAAGATDANIAAIKQIGGIDKVDTTPLLEAAGPSARRVLEAILRKRDDVKFERDNALGQSEEKLAEVAAQFRKEREQEAAKSTQAVVAGFDSLVPRVPDLQQYPIPAGADEATRKNLQAANAQIESTIRDAKALAQRSDPEARSELGVLAALSVIHRLRSQGLRSALVATRAQLDTATKEHAAKVKALEDQLSTLKGASRLGGGPRDVLKPSEPPKPAEVPFGASATAAFAEFEARRNAGQ